MKSIFNILAYYSTSTFVTWVTTTVTIIIKEVLMKRRTINRVRVAITRATNTILRRVDLTSLDMYEVVRLRESLDQLNITVDALVDRSRQQIAKYFAAVNTGDKVAEKGVSSVR